MFSGIRAGIATAQGIAAAVGVPVVAVSSLTLLGMRAATDHRRIWSIVDVRRGEVAAAAFLPVPGGVVRDSASEIVSPEELKGMINSDGSDSLVVGDVDALPDGFFSGLRRSKRGRPRYPSADVIIEYATMAAAREDFTAPEQVQPLYMREPDVKIGWSELRKEGPWANPA